MPTVCRLLTLTIAVALVSTSWGNDDPPPSYPTTGEETVQLDLPELPPPPAKITATPSPARNRPPRPAMMPQLRRLNAAETAHLPRQAQNVIDFYGGTTSARALSQLPMRPSSNLRGVARPPAVRQARKPFEGQVSGPPTISPYLNLFIEETNESLPNYHAFVRPMQRQMQTNQASQSQLNTLQHKVQQASYQQPSADNSQGLPATGHGTRYLNTSRFYPSIPRLR